MDFQTWFASSHPAIPAASAQAVLRLTAEGATIPFIARYRKEQTCNLDEVAIQAVVDADEKFQTLVKRQKHILSEIERQGKLTPELKEKILSTFQADLLEDLYLPYKQKRQTKAAIAKDAGLQELADWIWACGHGTQTPEPGQTLELWAFTFRNDNKGIKDAEAAIAGAQDILVERIAEVLELRQLVRTAVFETGYLRSKKGKKAKEHSKYENYFNYHESIKSLLQPQYSHRYLAVRRGWMEEELLLSIGGRPDTQDGSGDGGFEDKLLKTYEAFACTINDSPGATVLKRAAYLSLKAHVMPSIENEAHRALREVADTVAIKVFSENVRKLLMSSPFGAKAVLGIDPGVRTGCKLAVVDDSGKYIASTVLFVNNDDEKTKAKKLLSDVITTGNIRAIAIGNGTGGREIEGFARKALAKSNLETVPIVMVNEAGASVYSASEAAREEFPDLDVTVRGAISIARRLQDPLAELVKIDPKSIGVGQYQHDVSPNDLKKSLELVVDSCVNQVGVNLNTASYHLLSHVSGIGQSLAKAITTFRAEKGLFRSRIDLLNVPRFSTKTFEQAAGFLRIPEGDNPLDNTGVHPERYDVLENHAKKLGKNVADFMGAGSDLLKADTEFKNQFDQFTYNDIVTELSKPGRDPRDEFVPFKYREDIHGIPDLKPGMTCPGIVTNVTNFGAFVDIGVHQDGLVHLSQLSTDFIKDPKEVVSPGDRVTVRVLEVNVEKNQISLSMRAVLEAEHRSHQKIQPKPYIENLPKRNDFRATHIQARDRKPNAAKRPKPKEAFNNAFAGLASLKNQLKPGK